MATGSKTNIPRPWRKELTKKGKGNCGDSSILGSSVTGIWESIPGTGQGNPSVPQHNGRGVSRGPSTVPGGRGQVATARKPAQGGLCQPHLTRQACEDGTGLCFHHKQARHIRFGDTASWSLLPTTKRQLGSRQTSEARRGLAPRSLESSESFRPMQTPLNISSREMWRLPIFWKEKTMFRPHVKQWSLPRTSL